MKDYTFYDLLKKGNGVVSNLTFDKQIHLEMKAMSSNLNLFPQINFNNCIFKEGLIIENLVLENKMIIFNDCDFNNGGSKFWTNLNVNRLEFIRCTFSGLSLKDSEIKYCYFVDCSIKKSLLFLNITSDYVGIENDNSEASINTISCNSPEINHIRIEVPLFISFILIEEVKEAYIKANIRRLTIKSNKFQSITIEKEKSNLSVFSIENLNLLSSNFSGQIDIYDVGIKTLDIRNVNTSSGSIRLNEIKLNDAFMIDTSISSFYWNQVEFINPPELIRCDFSGLKMTNVKWDKTKKLKDTALDWKIPLLYGLRLNSMIKSELDYKTFEISEIQYQRDTYRQLKAASMANHNQIEALDFYRNEMRLYWKEIRINGGISLQNRLLVFLNRWSSDFGQNWILPIVWLFLFHVLWFSCLLSFGFWSNSKTGTSEFAEYFKLLNPTHEVPNYVTTGFGYLTDIVMRVSIAYFVYHIIRATRKYGKV